MSLRDRLGRLTGEDKSRDRGDSAVSRIDGGAGGDRTRALRERIDAILSRRPEGPAAGAQSPLRGGRGVPLEELVSGSEQENEAGRFFCAHRTAGGSARHGRFCVRDLAPLDMERLAVLANDPLLKALDYRQALFFDTETTGLAGGTGTVAFLIGLGWFAEEGFVTRQLFARDYAEERATLLDLTATLGDRRFLVSFNGKAFDANLLASRFIMNRLPNPLAALPHVDLLHPSRRLFSHRLADRRLGSLEAALLGFEREGDVPGSEIPQRYFDWLRRRDGRLMADVFEHNRLDILSLAALAAHLAELIDPAGTAAHAHPGDRVAAARLFLSRELPAEAVRLLAPLCGSANPDAARDAGRELSLHHKREGRLLDAATIWQEMVRRDGDDRFALIELAKWHEHKRRDFRQALELTERACAVADDLPGEERADLARRRERLERKLAGRGSSSSGA